MGWVLIDYRGQANSLQGKALAGGALALVPLHRIFARRYRVVVPPET